MKEHWYDKYYTADGELKGLPCLVIAAVCCVIGIALVVGLGMLLFKSPILFLKIIGIVGLILLGLTVGLGIACGVLKLIGEKD